jgi:hypothetical protein
MRLAAEAVEIVEGCIDVEECRSDTVVQSLAGRSELRLGSSG